MFKNLILTFFIIFSSFVTIYPSKKEKTSLIDYCYALEKILSRNTVEKSKYISKQYQTFAKNTTLFGINKTKGSLAYMMVDQFKNSKKSYLINILPNKFYCWAGYWIEELKPGTFQSIFYEKSKQEINQYRGIKKEIDEFIEDVNSEYKFIKKEIKDLF